MEGGPGPIGKPGSWPDWPEKILLPQPAHRCLQPPEAWVVARLPSGLEERGLWLAALQSICQFFLISVCSTNN